MPNNNVIQFHSVEKPVTIQPSVLFEDEDIECMSILKEDSDGLMQIFDEAVAEITKMAGLSGVHFAMDEASCYDVAEQIQRGMVGCFSVLYHGKKGSTEYLATVTTTMTGETESYEDGMEGIAYDIFPGLYRFQEDEVWRFEGNEENGTGGKWEKDKDEAEKFRILAEGGAEADFIRCLGDYMGFNAENISGGPAMFLLRENKKLVGLYKMMHGLADFDFDITEKDDNVVNIKTSVIGSYIRICAIRTVYPVRSGRITC